MQGDDIILTSHFARANGQWEDIENNQALVIFSEPHAYISTNNYDKELNVPNDSTEQLIATYMQKSIEKRINCCSIFQH